MTQASFTSVAPCTCLPCAYIPVPEGSTIVNLPPFARIASRAHKNPRSLVNEMYLSSVSRYRGYGWKARGSRKTETRARETGCRRETRNPAGGQEPERLSFSSRSPCHASAGSWRTLCDERYLPSTCSLSYIVFYLLPIAHIDTC